MNYQRLILVGNTTKDAELRTSKKGDTEYVFFTVAVGDAKGTSSYFPIVMPGEHGKKIVEYLKKGKQVLVEGRMEVNDNRQFTVFAHHVVLGADGGAGQ